MARTAGLRIGPGRSTKPERSVLTPCCRICHAARSLYNRWSDTSEEDVVAKKRVEAKRQRGTKKVKPASRAKAKIAPKKAASKKLTRKAVLTKVKIKPAARKPSKPLSTPAPAKVEPAPAIPAEPKPQAFFDPKGGQAHVTGNTKAHTKPEDQRGHIRMTAPRTWSNRQPGRG